MQNLLSAVCLQNIDRKQIFLQICGVGDICRAAIQEMECDR